MTLTPIHTDHPHYPFVEQLFIEAFPEDERRPVTEQRTNIDRHPAFACYLAADEDQAPIGFITVWCFGTFCYVEHFATDPTRRNGGFGKRIMQQLLQQLGRPTILEVEHPTEDMSLRRIGFYERQGFSVWDKDYIQPSYRPGGNSLPLYLMLHPADGCDTPDSKEVTRTIHREVYGVKD